MRRLTSAMCLLILGTWLASAFAQPAEEAQKKLQATWAATTAERDGKAADDVVGHRLSWSCPSLVDGEGLSAKACT